MTPMQETSFWVAIIMIAIGAAGVSVDVRKRENFRAYWWGRLSAWSAANADAAHQRKARHAMYHAVWMSRAESKDGELEPWGGASAPRVQVGDAAFMSKEG